MGSGAYKRVYRGLDNDLGCEVAWNVICLKNLPKHDRSQIAEEVKLNRKLNHPNIVHFISAWTIPSREELVFITELVTGGSLRQYLKKIKYPRLKVVKLWCRGILSGLCYLHSQLPYPIIHRDLKTDNIFVMSNTGDVKIGDFGLSTLMRNSLQSSVLGTPQYMAPELFEGHYNTGVDVYAFGMCVMEMCTLNAPYKECKNPGSIYKKVISGEMPLGLEQIQDLEVKDFVLECLKPLDSRPICKELLSHRFLEINENSPSTHVPVRITPLGAESPQSLKNSSQVAISIIVKHETKGPQQVCFDFRKDLDTPERVAEEMVKELALDQALVIPIAQEIEARVKRSLEDKSLSFSRKFQTFNQSSEPKTCDFLGLSEEPLQTLESSYFSENKMRPVFSESDLLSLEEKQLQSTASLKYVLKRGSFHNDRERVIALQRVLKISLNCKTEVDGYFGVHTESLVKMFQKMKNLKCDGMVTPELWKILIEDYERCKEQGNLLE